MTINRRTVVRGAAWTAPLVVIGAAAPAFATSTHTVTACLSSVCKTKHQPDNSTYKLTFSFTFDSPVTSFLVSNFRINGTAYAVTVSQLGTTYKVTTDVYVPVSKLNGTVTFNYNVNAGAVKSFSDDFDARGHYC